MNMEMLTRFFMWCSVLNGGLLMLSFLMTAFAGDFLYRMHGRWFPMPREQFNGILYGVLALYKILVFLFCIVPWVALSLM